MQEYGHTLSMHLNNIFPKLKEALNNCKEEGLDIKEKSKTGGVSNECIEKRQSPFASYKTVESNSRLRSRILLLLL